MVLIGICRDMVGFWERCIEYADKRGIPVRCVDMETSNWVRSVRECDVIIWRPNLDPPFWDEGREKIQFIEAHLRKRIVPNWATFWHYNNKRAQSYLFDMSGTPTPRTLVTYSAAEAMDFASSTSYPLVSKDASGASSEGVRILRTPGAARREIRRAFNDPLLVKVLRRLACTLRPPSPSGNKYVLWQEFIPANECDLRVTVVGAKYAFAFRRKNRPGDFRASGSGRIIYNVGDVRREVRLCAEVCRKLSFDVMAFDLLQTKMGPVVVEMSYAFNTQAVYECPGCYECSPGNELSYVPGHVWPQDLIVEYALEVVGGGGEYP